MKKAVIFDMDGVIVDSMPYHFIAWYETLRPFGIRVSCFDVYSKEGERWDRTLKDLLKRESITVSRHTLKKIFSSRQRIFKKNFKRFIFKGAYDLLLCLKKRRYILGLVTGTPLNEVEKILPLRIRKLFDSIVAGDQVKKGKPHPEPYLKIARVLRIRPADCVVIENAPFGVESAKKAGMFCIALTTGLPKPYLKDADVVAEKLQDIPGIVDKYCE